MRPRADSVPPADTGMTMGASGTFTIDELAIAAGMTPRNVRAYRTKGLLAPPARVGRISRYQQSHLRRLLEIRQLRTSGLPLKMIIDAAARGEDLGPTGALWQAAGPSAIERGRRSDDSADPPDQPDQTDRFPGDPSDPTGIDGDANGFAGTTGTAVLPGLLSVDPQSYQLMRVLRDAGVPVATILRLALRAAEAGRVLAQELENVLTEDVSGSPATAVGVPGLLVRSGEAPPAAKSPVTVQADDVIDLAASITREALGDGLARP